MLTGHLVLILLACVLAQWTFAIESPVRQRNRR